MKIKKRCIRQAQDSGASHHFGESTSNTSPNRKVRVRARLNQEAATDRMCAVHTLDLLAAKLEGTALPRQARALESLLRKQRVNLAEQATEHMIWYGHARALEMCLEESKKFPQIANQFKAAFAALKQAMGLS